MREAGAGDAVPRHDRWRAVGDQERFVANLGGAAQFSGETQTGRLTAGGTDVYAFHFTADEIKIDRSFVISMLDDPSAMTLVSTIISLAHALRLEVVADGVESEEQAKILRLVRCDQMQGYLISRPIPFDDMTTFLARHRS